MLSHPDNESHMRKIQVGSFLCGLCQASEYSVFHTCVTESHKIILSWVRPEHGSEPCYRRDCGKAVRSEVRTLGFRTVRKTPPG